jgi:hypothetical protein
MYYIARTAKTTYRVSHKPLDEKIFEYFLHILVKWADSFISDKLQLIAHIHKKNISKLHFEASSLPSNLSQGIQNRLFIFKLKIEERILFFRLILHSIVVGRQTYTAGTCIVTWFTVIASAINSTNLWRKPQMCLRYIWIIFITMHVQLPFLVQFEFLDGG